MIKKIEEKNETSISSNVESANDKGIKQNVIIDGRNLEAEGKILECISKEENSAEVPVEISYIINGENEGKLEIKFNNKVVHTKNIEKNIIEINRLRDSFVNDIFVLFEDGTVGKISISNIQNNKYDIVKVENCKNIVRIQSLVFEYENGGGDFALVAVENSGKIIALDTYSV